MLLSSSRLLFGAAALAAATVACSSPDRGSRGASAGAPRERAIAVDAVGDGESLTVTASVVDDRGQPTVLPEGEFFFARVRGSDYVLTLGQDEHGDPIYRAITPPQLAYVDVDVQRGSRSGPTRPLANVRVSEPFRIAEAPSRLRLGEELRVELAHGTTALSGRAQVTFEGPCLARMDPADLRTYGSYSEARFDTTNLPLAGGGCDATVTVMLLEERTVSTAPTVVARGIQQRTFVTRLDP